jgi:hypothetical protein
VTAVTSACARKLLETNRINTAKRFVKWVLEHFESGVGTKRTQNFDNATSQCKFPCNQHVPRAIPGNLQELNWENTANPVLTQLGEQPITDGHLCRIPNRQDTEFVHWIRLLV